jgi:subtilisin family serine protease
VLRALPALALGALLAGGPVVGAVQAQSFSAALPPAALSRLVEPREIDAAFAAAPGQPLRVIVEFATPELPAGVQSGTPRADSLLTGAVRTRQDEVMARAGLSFASPEAEAAAGLRRMPISPMFALNADPALLARLAADPAVVRIHVDRLSRPMLTNSLPVIGMPAAYAAGATGQGQVVAVLDSGARLTHEFLASRLVAGACFNTVAQGSISRCPGGATSATTLASSDDCTDPTIFGCGHGTHVSGIAAGFLPTPRTGVPAHGVARDARILSINVFAQFPGSQCGSLPAGYTSCILSWDSDQIAALNHIYSLRNTYAIGAVNMSLGGGRFSTACTNDSRRPAVQQLLAVGIPVIVASGNDGWSTEIGAPACIPEVVTVGSTTVQDARSGFSNWGPLVDVVAPGSAINASYINGTSNNSYALLSGTSMATPHVAGAFAALRSVAPTASVEAILTALQVSGTPISAVGTTLQRINVDLAIGMLVGGTPTTTTLAGPATSVLSQPVTFTATVAAQGGGAVAGSVVFRRDGVALATVPLDSAGQARATTFALPEGAGAITAIFAGGGTVQGSQSAALTHTVSRPATPANDAFANAVGLPGQGTYRGSTVGATAEAGEPDHAGVTTTVRSIWWRVTPTASGTMVLDTCGSTYDTTLAVYTGAAVNALTPVVANDDWCGGQSRVSFAATAGTTYRIAVAGWNGATGTVILNAAFTGAGTLPTTTTLAGPVSGQSNQSLTFTATVAATGATPTGTVSFRRDGVQFATGTLNASGQATGAAIFAQGSYTITAHYLGAAGFTASASAGRALTVTAPQNPIEFRGGGSLFAFTSACTAAGWTQAIYPIELRYGPGEVNGYPTQTAILFRTDSHHLQVWEPFAATTSVFNGLGRVMSTFFVLSPERPRVRPVQRRITLPEGATDITAAQEVMMRLRVENWGGVAGCSATVAGTLRRMP